MSINTQAVAAWYPHPNLPGKEMYWDGQAWIETMVRDLPTTSHGPMNNRSLNVKREVSYVRQQKGHSLTLHLLFGIVVLWVNVIYISASPNHHWHI